MINKKVFLDIHDSFILHQYVDSWLLEFQDLRGDIILTNDEMQQLVTFMTQATCDDEKKDCGGESCMYSGM